MTILETAEGFRVYAQYQKEIVNRIKFLQGRRWNGDGKFWLVPLEHRATLGQIYEDWKAVHSAHTAPAQVGVIPPLPELEIDIPLKRTPFPFQKNGIAYILKHKRVIVADKPGLGKTTQAIAAAVAEDEWPVLVICPSTLKLNWKKEWWDVAGMEAVILQDSVINTWPQIYKAGLAKVFIVNYESLKKFFVASIKKPAKAGEKFKVADIEHRPCVDLIRTTIVDESHKCRERTAQMTKFTISITIKQDRVYALTGTPIVNKTRDLITQLFMIRRMGQFGGIKFFEERYCKTNDYLAELHYRLSTTCFFQRKKKEVLKDLPDKTYQLLMCDITTRKEYDAAVSSLEKYLTEWRGRSREQVNKSLQGEIMVAMGVCKDIAARGKLEALREEVDELISNGEKVVIFAHHRKIIEKIKEMYPGFVTVYGADSPTQRDANVRIYQTDPKCMGIICSDEAADTGLNLTAGYNVITLELPWTSAKSEQCIDRLHRIGQKNAVMAKFLLGHKTIDQDIYEIIRAKEDLSNSITGNDEKAQRQIIDKIAASLFKGTLLAS